MEKTMLQKALFRDIGYHMDLEGVGFKGTVYRSSCRMSLTKYKERESVPYTNRRAV